MNPQHEATPMHASPPRPVVSDSQPHPLYLAALEARDEARRARAALSRARRQLAHAQARNSRAIAHAALAECHWVLRGARP